MTTRSSPLGLPRPCRKRLGPALGMGLIRSIAVVTVAALASSLTHARDNLHITGSSTVAPFVRAVAEKLAPRYPAPAWIEETGTGGGFHLFCAGIGDTTPDIAGASRRISANELALCRKNGVTPVELRIGYDGIVLAQDRKNPPLDISREQLYLALAANIPNADGQMIANPHTRWSDIASNLPARRIEVIGPPRTSGTRDAVEVLVLEEGCRSYQARLKVMIEPAQCRSVRRDGLYVDAGENDSLIVQKLSANSNAFGLFGFSYLLKNSDRIQAAQIEGNGPIAEAIFDGRYPLNRHLYVYAKKENVQLTPAIQEFLNEFTSDQTFGPEGYLARKGLIPLPKSERDAVGRSARALIGLSNL